MGKESVCVCERVSNSSQQKRFIGELGRPSFFHPHLLHQNPTKGGEKEERRGREG